jgi:steroid delta-isomerase-like uncharacterized protein
MSVDANILRTRQWFDEIWNRGNYSFAHELMTPDTRTHGQTDEPLVGPDAFLEFARSIHGAFPDLRLAVEDIFGVGDRVVVRWTMSATHKGDSLGMPATHRPVHTYGISIIQFHDGRAIASWDCWDRAGLTQQLTATAASA